MCLVCNTISGSSTHFTSITPVRSELCLDLGTLLLMQTKVNLGLSRTVYVMVPTNPSKFVSPPDSL